MQAINPAYINEIWEGVEQLLETVLPYSNGGWTVDSLYEDISTGTKHLWAADESIIVAMPIDRGVYFIVAAAGKKKELISGLPVLEQWAASEGLEAVEMVGRKGWLKELPDYKMQPYMRKVLNG